MHILIVASTRPVSDNVISFVWPRDGAQPVTDRLLDPERKRPISLGWVRWAGDYGQLVLAPPLLFGGMMGDHLIFRFTAGDVTYDISIHSWAPLAQALATLRRVLSRRIDMSS